MKPALPLFARFEPEGTAVIDRHLLAGPDRNGGDEVEGQPDIIAIDPGVRTT